MRPIDVVHQNDIPRYIVEPNKPSYSFSDSTEMSLTEAMALSKITPISTTPKLKKAKVPTKLKFVPEQDYQIYHYESFHTSLKDQIWYNQEDFGQMMECLDDVTRRRKKHIAGIRKCYIHTILELQDEHRAEGIHDPKGLACMAKRCTKYSTRDALTRGKEMEKEATRVERSETLEILKSVLDMMGEMDASCQPKQDFCLRPPMRLTSPKK